MWIDIAIGFGGLALLGLIGFIVAWREGTGVRRAPQAEKQQAANPAATLDAVLAIYGDIVRKTAEAEQLVRPLLERATETAPTEVSARQSRRPPG